MDTVAEELLRQLEAHGYRARIVAAGHLADLEKGIEHWRQQGALDAELDRVYLGNLRFSPPEGLAEARSLIIMADPMPAVEPRFTWRGQPVPVIIPPTYVYQPHNEALEALLRATWGPAGYHVQRVNAPVKLLATCSGLGRYGRNNVCYVPGLGSFLRLVAYCSDLPCPEDTWQPPAMLEACEHCHACRSVCPTGAIDPERFLLHAERCLTWHNERSAPMPEWIEPAWHNALVGCMRCLRACPENQPVLDWVEPGPEFSEEETALLLGGATPEQLPDETAAKLAAMDWPTEELPTLARNLSLVIEKGGEAHG